MKNLLVASTENITPIDPTVRDCVFGWRYGHNDPTI